MRSQEITARPLRRSMIAASCMLLLAGCASNSDLQPSEWDEVDDQVGSISASYHVFASVDELMGASDTVVRGKVISSRNEPSYPLPPSTDDVRFSPHAELTAEEFAALPPTPMTLFTVQVEEVVAGDPVTSQIEVLQVGGVVDGVTWVPENPVLTVDPGAELVMVLSETPSGYFDFPNPQQGAYSVTPDDALEPLSGTNDLNISDVSDLKEAAESADLEAA